MPGAVDAGLAVTQAMTGFEGAANSSDPAVTLANLSQAAAGFSTLFKVATSSGAALTALDASLSAALLTISRTIGV